MEILTVLRKTKQMIAFFCQFAKEQLAESFHHLVPFLQRFLLGNKQFRPAARVDEKICPAAVTQRCIENRKHEFGSVWK